MILIGYDCAIHAFARSLAIAVLIAAAASSPVRADAAFDKFLQSLWPEAQAARRLARDLRCGDARARARSVAARSGHPRAGRTGSRAQPEFVQTPAEYLKESPRSTRSPRRAASSPSSIARRSPRSSSASACRPSIVLAIWARETGLRRRQAAAQTRSARSRRRPISAGARSMFREEFLLALKMLQEGHVTLADMRSSWAGAMGQTAVSAVGASTSTRSISTATAGVDIWTSVPDALGTSAKHLVEQGLAARPALGLRGARAAPASTAPSRSRP